MAYLGRKGAAAPINASDIPDNSITSAKILADAVGSSDLAPDIVLTGGSVSVPSVTTANRPGESGGTNASQTAVVGMLIYNTTMGIMQQYASGSWQSISSPPTVSSLNYPGDDTALDTVGEYNDATCDYNNDATIAHDTNSNMKAGMSVTGTGIPVGATIASVTSTTAFELSASTTGGAVTNGTLTFNTQTLVITGTNFQTGVTVTIDGTAPSTVTKNSSTQITVTGTPAKTAGTKVDGLVVTNISGLSASINVDYSPLPGWTSPVSGNLLNDFQGAITDIVLTGGADTTSYARTTGALPAGLSLVDNDITGNMTAAGATYNFTIDAIDAQAQSSPRLFNIISKGALPTGGIIDTSVSGFRIHKFIHGMSESFTFGSDGAFNINILVVAGGGSGGISAFTGSGRGAGGGAGGLIYITAFPVTAEDYTVTVGLGGLGWNSTAGGTGYGDNGSNSVFTGDSRTLTAIGGGGGGEWDNGNNAQDGGSGGGLWYSGSSPPVGAGTQPSTTSDGISTYSSSGFGNDGGNQSGSAPYSGGGGGAGAVGNDWNGTGGPVGGVGKDYTSIFGSSYGESGWFAGGGGSANYAGSGYAGGTGGGGTGNNYVSSPGAGNGDDNTGGGGGAGHLGGSGIVLIRYAV